MSCARRQVDAAKRPEARLGRLALNAKTSMTEQGVPFVTYIWWGVFAPLKTPPDIIKRMHGEIAALQDTPEVARRLEEQGVMLVRQTSAEFGKYMQDEAARWQMVIDKAGIKGE